MTYFICQSTCVNVTDIQKMLHDALSKKAKYILWEGAVQNQSDVHDQAVTDYPLLSLGIICDGLLPMSAHAV